MKPQEAIAATVVGAIVALSLGGTAEARDPSQSDWTTEGWEALSSSIDQQDDLRATPPAAADTSRTPSQDDWTADSWEALNF